MVGQFSRLTKWSMLYCVEIWFEKMRVRLPQNNFHETPTFLIRHTQMRRQSALEGAQLFALYEMTEWRCPSNQNSFTWCPSLLNVRTCGRIYEIRALGYHNHKTKNSGDQNVMFLSKRLVLGTRWTRWAFTIGALVIQRRQTTRGAHILYVIHVGHHDTLNCLCGWLIFLGYLCCWWINQRELEVVCK